jgi:hypothetical protein
LEEDQSENIMAYVGDIRPDSIPLHTNSLEGKIVEIEGEIVVKDKIPVTKWR